MPEFLQKKGMVCMKTESIGPGSFRPDYPLAPGRFALGRFAGNWSTRTLVNSTLFVKSVPNNWSTRTEWVHSVHTIQCIIVFIPRTEVSRRNNSMKRYISIITRILYVRRI